ncbi:hypothetical protein Ccrd_024326 [Cynara cardunculus var. scolymus]|uniref:Uncharacterized protein n=1 Tax=Cynara cardunculus var. scolymus TaxID=59895 RepID=A0A103D575_CYNCS|nr:hypothetical protein Ccrd_024326 [Cynara cardunculus var. scolymus]
MTPRGMLPETATYGGGGGGPSFLLPHQLHYQQPPQLPFFHNQTNSLSFNNNNTTTTTTTTTTYSHNYLQEGRSYPSPLLRDHGLLQDMVSFQSGKQEPR